MGMLVVGTIVVNIIITIILLTVFLYYYNLAFECDIYPSFPCQTDWKCPGYAHDDDKNVVLVNANGYGITNAMMGCYLNALYGYTTSDGKNEFGQRCQYAKDTNGERKDIEIRPKNALSDKKETLPGEEEVVVSAGCNSSGGIVQTSDLNFGAVCKPGAYQNVYMRPGNTKVDTGSYDPGCDPNGPDCVNVAQLSCTNPTNNITNGYFSGMISSCTSV